MLEESTLELRWLTILKAVLAEFMGCFFINLFGCGAAVATNNYGRTVLPESHWNATRRGTFTYSEDYQSTVSIAFGVVYGIDVALFQHISGAHVNPSITLGMMAVRNLRVVQGLMYIPAQFLGSIAGSALLKLIIPEMSRTDVHVTHVYHLHGMTVWHGLPWEVLMSMQMMLVYLEAREDNLTATKSAAPLIIGISVMINHLAGIYAIGGSMNPAQSLGSAIVSLEFHDIWVYLVASPVGSVIGAFLHYSSFKPEPEEIENVQLPEHLNK